jgi:hypothetical protein
MAPGMDVATLRWTIIELGRRVGNRGSETAKTYRALIDNAAG